MIQEKVIAALANQLNIDSEEIKLDSTFEGLGLDSLDTVELIMELEEDLGIEMEADEKVETVGEFVNLIEQKVKS